MKTIKKERGRGTGSEKRNKIKARDPMACLLLVIYRLGVDGPRASPGHAIVHAIHDALLALIVDTVVLMLRIHSVHGVARRLVLHHVQHGWRSCHHARERSIRRWGARLNHPRELCLNRGTKVRRAIVAVMLVTLLPG